MLKITRRNTFEAAHFLPRTPEGHKCRNMHGHSYELVCTLEGSVDDGGAGWILDTAQIDTIFRIVHDQLDHKCLNDIIDNPTTENLAVWCWTLFHKSLGDVENITRIAIEIQESPRSTAYYDGP